jgi:low temperature requirement protein LtrA
MDRKWLQRIGGWVLLAGGISLAGSISQWFYILAVAGGIMALSAGCPVCAVPVKKDDNDCGGGGCCGK